MSTNFYSFVSQLFGFTAVYNKLYDSKQFQEFQQNISSGSSEEFITKCVRGFLLEITDKLFKSILLDFPELNDIFNNKELTKEMQCKLFIGTMIKKLYDIFNELNQIMKTIYGGNVPLISIGNMGLNLSQNSISKEEIIKYFLETLNTINKFDKINNAMDVYTILMEYHIEQITNVFYFFLKDFNIPASEDFLKIFIEDVMNYLNKIYNYKSECYNYTIIDCDDSDDSTSSSSSDNNQNIDTNPTTINNNNKRLNNDDVNPSKKPRN